jgi:protein TonB
VLASAVVHAALLGAALTPAAWRAFGVTPEPAPLAQVELVMQDTPTVGSGHAAPPPAPAAAAAAPAPPAPTAAAGPAPPLPSPAQPSAPPVRLDSEVAPGTGLVAGSQVIPATADDPTNAPPPYPPEAARLGEQGTVELLIQVSPDGRPAEVTITSSSGHPILDRAARQAVLGWHFRPAMQNGVPVASRLPFNVRYLMHPPQDPL